MRVTGQTQHSQNKLTKLTKSPSGVSMSFGNPWKQQNQPKKHPRARGEGRKLNKTVALRMRFKSCLPGREKKRELAAKRSPFSETLFLVFQNTAEKFSGVPLSLSRLPFSPGLFVWRCANAHKRSRFSAPWSIKLRFRLRPRVALFSSSLLFSLSFPRPLEAQR
jgi:hypothetical protein